MSGFGQFAASSQFYLYGKKHFTKTGYARHVQRYEKPDILAGALDLSGKVFMITGANSGVGKQVTSFLASKGATVYMVCRSLQRAESAKAEIVAETGSTTLHILEADVGLEADVRRCWDNFLAHAGANPRLDCLMCNAGALLNEKTLTTEGVEVTFASHLLFGTYLLGSLAMPVMKASPDSRVVVISSAGMYNSPFPDWEIATSSSDKASFKYDGQFAYVYAKRGQVLLCEQWAQIHPEVKVVSAHPGWTDTPAVEEAYGAKKSYLEPMRTPWEGAEGIAWLCVVAGSSIESGAFYLDRAPQVKHIAGPFFTEGSYTKNSPEEVHAMMENLEAWANGGRTTILPRSAPLTAMDRPIELSRFMGRWYVVANIPTYFDRDTVNNTEEYELDEANRRVQVTFRYSNKALSKTSALMQRAAVKNEAGTEWAISPKIGVYLPISIPYLIADCAEDYSTTIIGVPDRNYLWVMARVPKPEPAVMEALMAKVRDLGFDSSKVVLVPQSWEKETQPVDAPLVADGIAGA